jgi:uncharacterized membrane protein
MSLSFVFVSIASQLSDAEPMGVNRLIGNGLIVSGLLLATRSA